LTVVAGLFFLQREFGLDGIVPLLLLALPMAVLLGWMLSKLAIEPLVTHFETLERFSKETLHELNIPISTITTNTQMLRRNCDDERAVRRIGRIEAACDLLRMRYDELDYLIKRQMQREVVEEVAIDALVAERLDALREIYPSHGLKGDLEPISLKLDKMGFIKVIDNLVDNAVKHSPPGTAVTVTLRGRELRVRDEGRGMSELELFKVFDRYYQSDESLPGFGIGLDLVKRYCDRHRIALRIDSAPGRGTTMILDFMKVGT
jgi:signal transduction histidine kinase